MSKKTQPTYPWYVIVRKDNGYPLQIYASKDLAEHVATSNGEKVVPVIRYHKDTKPIDPHPLICSESPS